MLTVLAGRCPSARVSFFQLNPVCALLKADVIMGQKYEVVFCKGINIRWPILPVLTWFQEVYIQWTDTFHITIMLYFMTLMQNCFTITMFKDQNYCLLKGWLNEVKSSDFPLSLEVLLQQWQFIYSQTEDCNCLIYSDSKGFFFFFYRLNNIEVFWS